VRTLWSPLSVGVAGTCALTGPCDWPRLRENGCMVCAACRAQHHEDCPGGTWCDCQHQRPPEPSQPPMAWIRQG